MDERSVTPRYMIDDVLQGLKTPIVSAYAIGEIQPSVPPISPVPNVNPNPYTQP